MKTLMVGASGKFAGMVLPELKKRGATVRALIRSKDDEAEVREHGADEVAVGDLTDPHSLREAAEGVDGVFHINPAFAPHEGDLGVAMVRAACGAGVTKFVFSGVIHPSISKMSNHAEKRVVEEALFESGLVFTILQPAMFMQTMTASWKQIAATGRFALPYSVHAKACYVDYRDVAEVVAIAMTSDRLDHGTFELCAPGLIDRVQLAEIMSKSLGRTVEAGEIEFDEWARATKLPDGPMKDGMRKMYEHYDHFGFTGGNGLILEAILGRRPRALETFFSELSQQEA